MLSQSHCPLARVSPDWSARKCTDECMNPWRGEPLLMQNLDHPVVALSVAALSNLQETEVADVIPKNTRCAFLPLRWAATIGSMTCRAQGGLACNNHAGRVGEIEGR